MNALNADYLSVRVCDLGPRIISGTSGLHVYEIRMFLDQTEIDPVDYGMKRFFKIHHTDMYNDYYSFDSTGKKLSQLPFVLQRGGIYYIGQTGSTIPIQILGDVNCDGFVDSRDPIYLLYSLSFPDYYPLNCYADFDRDGEVTEHDAIYLLYYIFFPKLYPLRCHRYRCEYDLDACCRRIGYCFPRWAPIISIT